MPVLFAGLTLYGKAGIRREKEQASSATIVSLPKKSFANGLTICIFTGIFGSSINLGFAFGGGLIHRSLQLGASETTSTYAVWALVLAAGCIPNLLYCLFLIVKNRTWSSFFLPGFGKEFLVAAIMSALWVAGIFTYGIGTKLVGVYGISLGFALFTAAQILSANTLGMVAGEWSGTTLRTKRLLAVAAAVTLVSVLVLNLGGIWQ
jgi:L-rhamnose-H+ transport protein